ncbi:AhpA/YtjB family protein [Endozoicomonas sp. Mp262]|uniref:AhpA/YtjB family protein n=1 Tax=Endozoicomonas sp. Mp262 TaxID=2919499 RepID=UPI0021D86270
MKLPNKKSGIHAFPGVTRLSLKLQLMLVYGFLMSVLTVLSCLLISTEIDNSSSHQADTIGSLLSEQTASAAANMLITGDRLSLNVLLNQLTQNPYIAEASIYSIDNHRIARAEGQSPASFTNSDTSGPVYSAPINYQDVIAGYVRLKLDYKVLTQKPKESLQVIIAVSALLLVMGLVFLNFYATKLADKLRLIERQLHSIFKTLPIEPLPATEVDRIASLVEHQLTEKIAAENAEKEKISGEKMAAIVSIRTKNFGRLQSLLAPQELIEIIRQQTAIVVEAAKTYGGTLSYTPEGNSYIRFSSQESDTFAMDALCCSLLIEKLSERATENSIARIQLGLGLCLSDQVSEFPEGQHPALANSAASQALMLASLPEPDGLHMLRKQLSWLPADITEIELSEHGDDIIRITSLTEPDDEEIEHQAEELETQFH